MCAVVSCTGVGCVACPIDCGVFWWRPASVLTTHAFLFVATIVRVVIRLRNMGLGHPSKEQTGEQVTNWVRKRALEFNVLQASNYRLIETSRSS